MITAEQLKIIMPFAKPERIALFLPWLNKYMPEYFIESRLQKAAFLAQIGHESGSLTYVREIASGKAYEGRWDLGNSQPGDGVRFKGRGLIQITGRGNYIKCSRELFGKPDVLLNNPELLEQPEHAVHSACWFWEIKDLNTWAAQGEFEVITRKINGGLNGLADRKAFYARALKILK